MLWPIRGAIVAVLLFSVFTISEAVEANFLPALFDSRTPDFFIIRSGSVIALSGESPYQPEKVQEMVARQFPNDKQLIENSAFFLPPATLPIYAPFAAIPYPQAKIAWAILVSFAAAAVLLVFRSFGSSWPSSSSEHFLPLIVLLNYLTLAIVELGQTSFLFVGSVLLGQWCFERRERLAVSSHLRRALLEAIGAFLWAIPFIKPHLAISLLPLAWYLGGWKRPAAILAFVVALNVTGCLMIGRSPLFLWDYVQYLGSTHKGVKYNRVENVVITSWNRLLFGLGGPAVELSAVTTIASYLVWYVLVFARVAIAGKRPSAAWAAAVTAVGGVFCSQVLIYESLFLVLVIPWVRSLFAEGYRNRGWMAVALLCLQLIPFKAMQNFGFMFHHALGVALLAIVVMTVPIFSFQRSDKS